MLPFGLEVAMDVDHKVFGGAAQQAVWKLLHGATAMRNISSEIKAKAESVKKLGPVVRGDLKTSAPVEIFKVAGQLINAMCKNNANTSTIVVRATQLVQPRFKLEFLGSQIAHKVSPVLKSPQYNYHCKQGLECTAISNGTTNHVYAEKCLRN